MLNVKEHLTVIAQRHQLTFSKGSSNANEALHISLIQSGATAPIELASFHPQFTYPIFGDEEQIFGYKDLRIDVRFAAHNMHSDVQIAYSSKFPAVGDTEATDMEKILEQFLPDGE